MLHYVHLPFSAGYLLGLIAFFLLKIAHYYRNCKYIFMQDVVATVNSCIEFFSLLQKTLHIAPLWFQVNNSYITMETDFRAQFGLSFQSGNQVM